MPESLNSGFSESPGAGASGGGRHVCKGPGGRARPGGEGQRARIMVASSGPGYPFPEALTASGGRRIGMGSVHFLRAHREALGAGWEVGRLSVSTLWNGPHALQAQVPPARPKGRDSPRCSEAERL